MPSSANTVAFNSPTCDLRTCIFDLDGTLLDSLADLADSVNEALDICGLPTHPRDAFREFIGDGVRSLCERAMPAASRQAERIERVVSGFREIYSRRWNALSVPYVGIGEVLDRLTERGIQLAVLSNKPHAFTVACVEHYFRQWPFAVVLGQRDGVARKPDPAAAWEIANRIGRKPAECAFVGDSAIDVLTGRNAGMTSVAVSWGFRTRDELTSAGPDYLLDSPPQLLELPYGSKRQA